MKGYLHYLDLQKRKEFYRELRQVGEAHRSLTSSSRMIAFYLGKQLEKEQKLLKKSSKNMKSVQGNASITESQRFSLATIPRI